MMTRLPYAESQQQRTTGEFKTTNADKLAVYTEVYTLGQISEKFKYLDKQRGRKDWHLWWETSIPNYFTYIMAHPLPEVFWCSEDHTLPPSLAFSTTHI